MHIYVCVYIPDELVALGFCFTKMSESSCHVDIYGMECRLSLEMMSDGAACVDHGLSRLSRICRSMILRSGGNRSVGEKLLICRSEALRISFHNAIWQALAYES